MIDRNELLAEADELADLIIRSPEITAFQVAEEKLKANVSARYKMQELRDLQDQVGELQSRKVPLLHYKHLFERTDALLLELEKIEEVQLFQSSQQAVNSLLQEVTGRLATAVMTRVSPASTSPMLDGT